jgi:hypothetical protein
MSLTGQLMTRDPDDLRKVDRSTRPGRPDCLVRRGSWLLSKAFSVNPQLRPTPSWRASVTGRSTSFSAHVTAALRALLPTCHPIPPKGYVLRLDAPKVRAVDVAHESGLAFGRKSEVGSRQHIATAWYLRGPIWKCRR